MKNSSKIIVFLLAALSLFHIVNNVIYTQQEVRSPSLDEMTLIERSMDYHKILTTPSKDMIARLWRVQWGTHWPLYPFVSSLVLLFVGLSEPFFWMCIVTTLFVPMFIVGLYLLGKYLHDRTTGLLAALVGSTAYLNVHFHSHKAMQDFPFMAIFTLTMAVLLLTDNLRKRGYTILFGLLLGLSTIMRLQAIISYAGPAFFLLWNSVFYKNQIGLTSYFPSKPNRIPWLNIFIVFLFGLVMPAVILFPGFIGPSSYFHYTSQYHIPLSHMNNPAKLLSFDNILYYYRFLIYDYITIFFSLLFVIGLILSICVKNFRRRNLIILSWFFINYSVLTFGLYQKSDRFGLPLMIPVAILSVFWISHLKPRIFRYFTIFLVVFMSISFFAASKWDQGPLAKHHRTAMLLGMKFLYSPYISTPQRIITNAREVMKLITDDAKGDKIDLLLLFRQGYLSQGEGQLNYYILYSGIRYQIGKYRVCDSNIADTSQPGGERWRLNVISLFRDRYILTKTREVSFSGLDENQRRVLKEGNEIFKMLLVLPDSSFKFLGKVPIPYDDSEFRLYKRTKELSVDEIILLASEGIRRWPMDKEYYINFFQSALIEKLKAKYDQKISPKLSLHLFEEASAPYIWSMQDLMRLLDNIGGSDREKMLLVNTDEVLSRTKVLNAKFSGYSSANKAFTWEADVAYESDFKVILERFQGKELNVDGKSQDVDTPVRLKPGRHMIYIPFRQSSNLIRNHSFEDGVEPPWYLMSSTAGQPGEADVTAGLEKDSTKGKVALNLTANRHIIGVYQHIEEIGADDLCILSFDYKHITGLPGEYSVWEDSQNTTLIPLTVLDKQTGLWQSYLNDITPLPGTKKLTLYFYSRSGGSESSTNLYDNVRLYKVKRSDLPENIWLIRSSL